MHRREFLKVSVAGSLGTLLPAQALASDLAAGREISFECLGAVAGPRFLDGRTGNGTVGLVPDLRPAFSGTRWRVYNAGPGAFGFKCMGSVEGSRWLDGHTQDGSVGLAPNYRPPFTGTRWQAVSDSASPSIVTLRCLGNIEGPRFLDGRTGNGTVGLAANTAPPFSGTRWRIASYPVQIDSGTNLVPADH